MMITQTKVIQGLKTKMSGHIRKSKRISGFQSRKRRVAKEEERKQLAGSFEKYLKTKESEPVEKEATSEEGEPECEPLELEKEGKVKPDSEFRSEEPGTSQQHAPIAENLENVEETESQSGHTSKFEKFEDPALWEHPIGPTVRRIIVEKGPLQLKNQLFPVDSKGRKFSISYYTRVLKNGETINRSWLVYSNKNNSVFCFCCKLFCKDEKNQKITYKGYSDWQNLSLFLKRHETSNSHVRNYQSWMELIEKFKTGTTLDATTQKLFDIQCKYWYKVLERMLYAIQFLAKQCLPLRGKQSKFFQPNNGNFFKLLEMLSKFDPVMMEHLNRISRANIMKKTISHYAGVRIQNELIDIMANTVKSKIINDIKNAKYYSVILDCTPDKSKIEQISVILRYVITSKDEISIKESFIEFCPVVDVTGKGLAEFLMNNLKKLGLEVNNIRGQGYDNGANMRGKNIGLQKLILNQNSRAFFVPCSSHSLNLVVNDAAKATHEVINFFSIIQHLYNFFSASTNRWDI